MGGSEATCEFATRLGQQRHASRSTALAAAINQQALGPDRGAYRLSREVPNAYPQDANAVAILTGVASPAQAGRALAYLRKHDWSTYGSLTLSPDTPNPVMSPSYEPLPSGFEAEAPLAQASPRPGDTRQCRASAAASTFSRRSGSLQCPQR